jgi:hypothetical protein
MAPIIPNEIVSKIVDYVSDDIGFDYKYCKNRNTWRFLYNAHNKICSVINDLIVNRWCVRRFYNILHSETRKIENSRQFVLLKNFGFAKNLGVLYYTIPREEYEMKNIKVDVYTNIDGFTSIGLYKEGFNNNMIQFYKMMISNKNDIIQKQY